MDKEQLKKLQGKEFLAAAVPPGTLDREQRTVDIVFFTGIDVPRMDWWTGDPYVLRFDPKGADLSLLNNGAPILDNHSMWDGSSSQKGKVEKAWNDKGTFKATLRFSKRKSVDEIWQDIEDSIATKFSMGVSLLQVEKFLETGKDGKDTAVRLARKWQPFEISLAPIPADFGTTTLAAGLGDKTTRASARNEGENNMSELNIEGQPGVPAGVSDEELANAKKVIEAERRELARIQEAQLQGQTAELARVQGILEVTRICNLPQTFSDRHIKAKTDIHKVREYAIEEQARLAREFPDTRPGRVNILRDETDTRRTLMGNAIHCMMDREQKVEGDNQFAGLTIKQVAEESVRLQYNLRGTPPTADVIRLSMQSTADFANVLESTARKVLLARYEYANPTYRLWTKRSTTPDFKTMSRTRIGETPQFLTVPEGAQITIGTMTDSKETYALATYGRGVSFTRQMLINDDLGAFNDLIGAFGVQAARLENKTVYAILTANANMSDNNPLFDALHGNSGTGAIGNTSLDAMFTAMAIQKGIDATTVLNLTPRFLIVPKAKESTARAALMAIGPNVKAADQNWFAGRLEPVADAELDGNSTVKWYGAADPNDAPGIEFAHLEGQEGPQFIRKENESGILGIQFYAFLDFAAKAIDWRPLYYSTGA